MSTEFDWGFAESQFSDPTNYERPPEDEIYGRSLSTIRRLGAFMIDKTGLEVIESPEAAQARVEFYTSVEEGFGTDMELGGGLEVRDFDTRPIINGRVMAKDLKTAISTMTEAGLACAEKTGQEDRHFLPQLTRSKWDHQNALIVDEMARGETSYNTRIVVSPFPEEAAAESGDEYWRNIGYVPHLKRGFVQLYHTTEDGVVISGSLSFDGSDKRRLHEIFDRFGVAVPADESTDNWLKYAITGNFDQEEAKVVATAVADQAADPRYKKGTNTVDVTRQYRTVMERAFNESYIHICESLFRGRQTEGSRKLIHQLADKARYFNQRYATALYGMRSDEERFTDDDSAVLHELLVYSTIEMMRALHLEATGSRNDLPIGDHWNSSGLAAAQLASANEARFLDMLGGFGAEGALNKRTYSACGIAIALGGKDLGNGPQTAFGGMDKELEYDKDNLGSRWFTCQKGHMNYRKKANIKEDTCHACGMDVSCKEKPKPELPKNNAGTKFFEEVRKKKSLDKPKLPDQAVKVGGKALAFV